MTKHKRTLTAEQAFTKQIAPLVAEIKRIAKKHNIVALQAFYVELEKQGEVTKAALMLDLVPSADLTVPPPFRAAYLALDVSGPQIDNAASATAESAAASPAAVAPGTDTPDNNAV